MNDSIVTRSLNSELSTLITKSTAADLRSEEQRFALLCSMKDAGFEFAINVKAYDPEANPLGATKPEREFLRDAVIKGLPKHAQEILALGKAGMKRKTDCASVKKSELTTGNWVSWNKQPASRLSKIAAKLDSVVWSDELPVFKNGEAVEDEFTSGWVYEKDLPNSGDAQTPKTSRTKILEALAKAVAICEKDETPDYDATSIKKAINAVIKSL